MRRRDFLKVAASLAVAGRSVAVAQQAEPNQRIGVLSNLAAEDPEGRPATRRLSKLCRN